MEIIRFGKFRPQWSISPPMLLTSNGQETILVFIYHANNTKLISIYNMIQRYLFGGGKKNSYKLKCKVLAARMIFSKKLYKTFQGSSKEIHLKFVMFT